MKIKISGGLILCIIALTIILVIILSIILINLLRGVDEKWLFSTLIIFIIAVWIYELRSKRRVIQNNSEFLKIGKQLFQKEETQFVDFYNLFLKNKKKFVVQNVNLLRDYENFDFKNLSPLEALYIYGHSKNLVHLVDWRGEENIKEIENFIEELLNQKPEWTNTEKVRADTNKNKKRKGECIIDLFKAMDKDLQKINQKLIFFNLNWDAYVFTTVDLNAVDEILSKASESFHKVNKLKR